MAKGDVLVSPYRCEFIDYFQRRLTIVLNFNDTTRAITGGVVHRDAGCLWSVIVWDDPNDPVVAKPLPAVPAGDTAFTANQVRQQTGFQTIEDVLAVQITAK